MRNLKDQLGLLGFRPGGDPSGGPGGTGANFFDQPHDLTTPDGQPAGSDQKDRLENRLHKLVCAGKMPLAQAQYLIAKDWVGAYRQLIGPLP